VRKMPAISFSTLKAKLLSGEKTQTIRPKRSDFWLRFRKGDVLHCWWKLRSGKREKLFDAIITEVFVVKWSDFTDELMIRDGFESLREANRKWFIPHYGENGNVVSDKEFVVIRWKR